jgi:putative transposase
MKEKRQLIDTTHTEISIQQQCQLLGLARSSYYYQPKPPSDLNLLLMDLIDKQYTLTPFYGAPRISAWLRRQGYRVNHKRIERLMRLMGLEAIRPRPRTSRPVREHQVYPYLLQGVSIDRPDQVWAADITYLGLERGFLYLVAIMDWFSRYVLSWELSNTLEQGFCLTALEQALRVSKPEIFNTDQGSQFTSREFTTCLQSQGIAISMDGRGRLFDNIFVERLWRTVKYEDIYLKHYQSPSEVRSGLRAYFQFYNSRRLHSSLGYQTPEEVYFKEKLRPEPRQMLPEMHLKSAPFLS